LFKKISKVVFFLLLFCRVGFAEEKTYSQASQDRFVYLLLYQILDKQDAGYYLEIGAGPPAISNNTYFFEKKLGWNGSSIDISNEYKKAWYASRHNSLLIEDATQSDYRSILKPFPKVIDYLSIDIDSGYNILLKRIPFEDYIFKVITIEHDFYRFGDEFRAEERKILTALGYHLLCPDVSVFFSGMNCVFEDWWVHSSVFPADVLATLKSLDLKAKDHEQLIKTLESYCKLSKTNP
jgi:hypothetical protein